MKIFQNTKEREDILQIKSLTPRHRFSLVETHFKETLILEVDFNLKRGKKRKDLRSISETKLSSKMAFKHQAIRIMTASQIKEHLITKGMSGKILNNEFLIIAQRLMIRT